MKQTGYLPYLKIDKEFSFDTVIFRPFWRLKGRRIKEELVLKHLEWYFKKWKHNIHYKRLDITIASLRIRIQSLSCISSVESELASLEQWIHDRRHRYVTSIFISRSLKGRLWNSIILTVKSFWASFYAYQHKHEMKCTLEDQV